MAEIAQVQCPNCHNYKVRTQTRFLNKGGRDVNPSILISLLPALFFLVGCALLANMGSARTTGVGWGAILVMAAVVFVIADVTRRARIQRAAKVTTNTCDTCGYKWQTE